jgi:2-(1,2-epoxy-1,2-dihydrophenyl)acetyl-CoA isomerase
MSVTSVEVGGGVVVALDRSKRANSIDLAAAAELRAALRDGARTGRFVVLTGTSPFFCCGLDRAEVDGLTRNRRAAAKGVWDFESLIRCIRSLPVPVVAFADGAVVGGGCGIFWSADTSLAGESFRFRVQFARLGMVPDMGTSSFGPRRTDRLAFERLYLQDRMFEAAEAQAMGLTDNEGSPTCDLDTAIAAGDRLSRDGWSPKARRPRGLLLDAVLARETVRQTRRVLRLDAADLKGD